MTTGRAQTVRHNKRAHRVSVACIHERVASDDIQFHDFVSAAMAADLLTKQFRNRDTWIEAGSLFGVVEPDYIKQMCIPTASVRGGGGCACCATLVRISRAMASPPTPSMGPDAIHRATARFSAAPASVTRACQTSLHHFFCAVAVHNARVAGEEDVPKLRGEAVRDYYLETLITWDTTDECFTAKDVASTEAEPRSAGLVLSYRI